MPYRGTNQAQEFLQAFLAAQQNKRANKELESIKDQRFHQQQMDREYLALAKQRQFQQTQRQQVEASQQDALFKMKATEYERGRAEDARVRGQNQRLAQAETTSRVGSVYGLLKKYPELVPDARLASDAMQRLQSDEERAAYAGSTFETLQAKAQLIEADRTMAAFRDSFRRGGMNGSTGEPDEKTLGVRQAAEQGLALYMKSGGKMGTPPHTAAKMVEDSIRESAQDEAITRARREAATELRDTWGMQIKDPDQRAQFYAATNEYERLGGMKYGDLIEMAQGFVNPKPERQSTSAQQAVFDSIIKTNPEAAADPKKAWQMAGEIVNGGGAQGGGGGQQPTPEQIAFAQANPNLSDEQLQAAWDRRQSGGTQRPAPPAAVEPPYAGATYQPPPFRTMPSGGTGMGGNGMPPASNPPVSGPQGPDLTGYEKVTTATGSRWRPKEKVDEAPAQFARGLDPYSRLMTRAETDEARALRKSGSPEDRAAFLARMQAKYGKGG